MSLRTIMLVQHMVEAFASGGIGSRKVAHCCSLLTLPVPAQPAHLSRSDYACEVTAVFRIGLCPLKRSPLHVETRTRSVFFSSRVGGGGGACQ